MYNCHVIISNTGRIQAAYRKVHLFDVDVPNGPVLMESRSTAPGKEVSVSDNRKSTFDQARRSAMHKAVTQPSKQKAWKPSVYSMVSLAWPLCPSHPLKCSGKVIRQGQVEVESKLSGN